MDSRSTTLARLILVKWVVVSLAVRAVGWTGFRRWSSFHLEHSLIPDAFDMSWHESKYEMK